MSRVIYGDVELDLVKINSFGQETVLDDGQNYLYTRYVVDVNAVFSVDLQGVDPAAYASQVALELARPRRRLTVAIGSSVMLDVGAPDHKGGPFPKVKSLQGIRGTRTCMVNWTCEAYLHDCASPPVVLSNTWEMSQSYDENLFATRNTNGKLIANGSAGSPPSTDAFRHMCMPPLPKGWKRQRMTFGVSADGLMLIYNIEDKEVDRVAPSPATSAQGHYSEMTEHLGAKVFADIAVDLRGPKGKTRKQLLNAALLICASRIDYKKDVIIGADVTEDLFDNHVSVSMRAMKIKDTAQISAGLVIDPANFDKDVPGSEPDKRQPDLNERQGLMRSAAAAWRDPCSGGSSAGGSTGGGTGSPSGSGSDPVITYTKVNIPKDGETKIPSEQKADVALEGKKPGKATEYEMDMVHKSWEHYLQLPIAQDKPLSSGGTPNVTKAVTLRTFGPIRELMVKTRAEGRGGWPRFPNFYFQKGTGTNPAAKFKLKSSTVTPESPKLGPDGQTFIYTIRGEALYAADEHQPFNEVALEAGQMPIVEGPERSVPTDVWTQDILFKPEEPA